MNEVRDICARMLDEPEPPLREAGEVLAVARRAKRRRAWLTATGAGATSLVLTLGIIGVIGPDLFGDGPAEVATGAGRVPVARSAASHGDTMARLLLDAVPSGHVAGRAESFSDSPVIHPTAAGSPGQRVQILAAAVVAVFGGAGKGQLMAYLVHDGQPGPAGDLCAAEPLHDLRPTAKCEVRWVGDVPIRVVTTVDDQRGQVVEATRFLDGGRLTVAAWQGVPLDPTEYPASARWWLGFPGETVWRRPPLDLPLLDAVSIAALAGDAAMVP